MHTGKDRIKVAVGMSGGVDSSVAAALLKEKGYDVSGVTMRIWDGQALSIEGTRHGCYGPGEEEDIEEAQRVSRILGIDSRVFDLRQEYKAEVLDYFRHEYLSGRTPNPCLKCNHRVKFNALLKKTRDSGIEFDFFATGHYARVEYKEGRYLLKKARDKSKDQTYFISSLSQEQLGQVLFPIGDYTKEEVRRMATDFGLGLDSKAESQDFIEGGHYSLLGPSAPGPIMDKLGNILGEHQGAQFYTIGQRKGLGIASKAPLYVIDINAEENAIIVSGREDLYRDELIASEVNWIAFAELKQPDKVRAKIRSGAAETEATITPLGEQKVYVKFTEAQPAITPGQTIAFYREDVVIGSGTIEKTGELTIWPE